MLNHSVPQRLPLLALITALVLASHPLLADTPTYTVYFDGAFGGTLVVEGAPDMPEGACGIRVSEYDTLEWYWAEYNGFGLLAPMPDPFGGPPNSTTNPPGNSLYPLIEFTGPFGDECGDEFVFLDPTTGIHPTWANGIPQGSSALVFQTLPGGVEWLTESFTLWEPPGDDPGDEPDPEYVNICELFPDLCIEPGFVYEDPCRSNIFDCGDSVGAGVGALKAAVAVSAGELVLAELGASTSDPKLRQVALDDVLETVRWAQDAHRSVVEFGARLIGDVAPKARHPETRLELDALQIAIDLAEAGLASCTREVEALRSTKGRTATRALEACNGARSTFRNVDDRLDRLVTWGVTREQR
jgi:hypothetical protein